MRRNYSRMLEWLLLAALFYAAALNINQPQLQTLCWKLGHVTVGCYAGYLADRHLIGRIDSSSDGLRQIARAIIVLAVVYGVSGGL